MHSLCVCHCRHIKATQNKQHKREREIFFLVYWNGDEATRYTCTFFNKSLNFHAPQPYHSSAFSIIVSLLFYSLFAVCLSACFFTVFDALSIAPPPPLPPFWHGTLSTTNHRSDKKMRDEISSIMPKLSRWIWKKRHLHYLWTDNLCMEIYPLLLCSGAIYDLFNSLGIFVCSALHRCWIDFSNLLFILQSVHQYAIIE